jgi:hypothetical protein
MMRGFDPRTAPVAIAIKLSSTSEKALKRAVKKFCNHFGIENSMLALLQIADYHGYVLGVVDNYAYLIREESELDAATILEPEFWRMTLETEPDSTIVQRIK